MSEQNSLIKQELEKYIVELHKDYEVWYAKSVRKTFRWWWFLQVMSLLSGFTFALIAALVAADVFQPGTIYKTYAVIALVVLPALSALAANTVIQFRVYDIWRLREKGRISFQNLVIEGRRRLSTAKTEEDYADIFAELQDRANKIEFSQSEDFFSFNKSDFASNFTRAEINEKKLTS